MLQDWNEIFPTVRSDRLEYGILHFKAVTEQYQLADWTKQGTLYCRGSGMNRVGFAIRNTCVAWHFRDREPLEYYLQHCDLGTVTEVTIKFKHGEAYDPSVLQQTIDLAFSISE